MKRDMDLIRDLMLRIENGDDYIDTMSDSTATALGEEGNGLSEEESRKLEHHMWLLKTSGFVEFTEVGTGWIPDNITWEGHDFLDSIRDPEIWRRTKEGAEAAGGFTVELLRDLAKGLIKTQIKKHTGVEL